MSTELLTGNPFTRQTAALRQALLDAVTAQDLAAVARALIEKAAAGDTAAARLLLSYVLGKPGAAADPDRVDADEWQKQKETAGMMAELPQVLQSPAPDLPLETVRATRPTLTREMSRQLGAMLAEPEKYQPPIPDLELAEDAVPAPVDLSVWAARLGPGAAAANGNPPGGRRATPGPGS